MANSEKSKKKKIIVIIALIVAFCLILFVVIAVILLLCFFLFILPTIKLQKKIDLGNSYYSSREYENAIYAFEESIEMDSECEEAYIKLGSIYSDLAQEEIENGDYEKAIGYYDDGIDLLKKGRNNTGSEEIGSILKELKDLKNDALVMQEDEKSNLYDETKIYMEEDQVFIVATNAEFPPYEYYETDRVAGIDIEIMDLLAKKMGYRVKYKDMAFGSVFSSVSNRETDLGIAAVPSNNYILDSSDCDISVPYIISEQVVLVRDDSDIISIDDLEGKKIGVKIGTTAEIYAEDIYDAYLEKFNSGNEAIDNLYQGKIDAVIMDKELADELTGDYYNIVIMDKDYTYEEYVILVPKNEAEFLDKINAVINDSKEEINEIKMRYILE